MKAVIKGEGFFPTTIERQLEHLEEMREKTETASLNQLNKGIAKREIFSPDQLSLKRQQAEKEAEKQHAEKQKARVEAAKKENEKMKQSKQLGEQMIQPLEDSKIIEEGQARDDIRKHSGKGGTKEVVPSYDPQATPNIVASRPNLVSESLPGSSVYATQKLTAERRVYPSICVPWTVSQITNLESSFYRAGWRVTNVASVEWLSPHEAGRTFYDYYHEGQYLEGAAEQSYFAKMFTSKKSGQEKQQQVAKSAA